MLVFPTPPEAMRDEWIGLPWLAVEAPHMRETEVAVRVAQAGLPAIAPLRSIEVRACRYDARTVKRAHPALPGYVFVALREAADWPVLLGTRGATRVVSVDGRPALIPAAQIVRFLRRVAEVPEVDARPAVPAFEAGQMLVVTGGAWAGRTVRFEAMRGPQADVIGQMLGAERAVRIPVDRLAAA